MAYRENSGQDDAQFKPKRKFKIEKADMNTQVATSTVIFTAQIFLLAVSIYYFGIGNIIVAGKSLLSIVVVGLFGIFWKYNYSFEKEQ